MNTKQGRSLRCLAFAHLLSAVWILFITGQGLAEEQPELWIHPYLPATEIIKKFAPLAAYLSEKTGQTFQVKVSKTYQSHIEAVGQGFIDMAYLGPASYVKLVQNFGAQRLLACLEINGKPYFHGIITARKDSPITALEQLAGKKFAFSDPNSTMGHLVPRYMLWEKGVSIERLKKADFLNSHHDVALGVLGGYYDAGGLKEEVFYEYKNRGLKLLAQSPPIAEHLFVAGKNLEICAAEEIRGLLINLKDKPVLTAIKPTVTGLVTVTDADYETLRRVLERFNTPAPE